MKPKIVIVATVASLVLAWLTFRHWAARVSPLPEAPNATAPTTAPEPPSTPTPSLLTTTSTTPAPPGSSHRQPTNFLALILNGDSLPVTTDQLATYLQANHRDADSLLAAYQATHERALLDEAISKYPNDPHVAYGAWFRSPGDPGTPDGLKARRQALDLLKQAAPDNALANYLSAANYFKSGQPDQAIQELQAGAAKPNFNDYTQDAIQSMTEAYLAAGYSEAEAKLAALSGALLPHLAELKQDGQNLVALAKSYQQAGDGASAQAVLQMCRDLGQRLDVPSSMTLIQPLVGIALQRMGLAAAATMATDADTSQAIQDQLNSVVQHRDEIKALAASQPIEQWLQTAPPEDIVAYCDRHRIFGEQSAMQWLVNRTSKP